MPEKKERQHVDLVVFLEKNAYADRYIKLQAFTGVLFGWHSAAILENIRQWVDYAKVNHDKYYLKYGHYWTRRSYDDLIRDLFGMMSLRTIKERVKYLERIGVLVSYNFNKVYENSEGYTRKGQTKWYRLNEEKINSYARQLDDYICWTMGAFGDNDYLEALAYIGQKSANGMGFIIYDSETEKVGIAPDVIRAYGYVEPEEIKRKIGIC